jgi:hypothetical protein
MTSRLRRRLVRLGLVGACIALATTTAWGAVPAGFVKQTIPLNAPPVGLAFDADGVLYALEGAEFGTNQATLRAFLPDGTDAGSFPIVGDDPFSFYVGGMMYDPVSDRLLITDNTAEGKLLAVDKLGNVTTVASNILYIAGVAVRRTGEIFVSTANGLGAGAVRQVDRNDGTAIPILTGLDYSADLAFDSSGNLLVQDSYSTNFTLRGRIQRLPITETPGGLQFGSATLVADDLEASYGLAFDSEDDLFATGAGGLYRIDESLPGEVLFYTDGSSAPIATAIAFHASTAPFEPFAGPGGGRLAINADFGYVKNDLFVTLLTPAVPGDYDANGTVDAADYLVWKAAYGTNNPAADGNRDGVVDAADYTVWRNHLTSSLGTAGMATIVPEPSVWSLGGWMMAAFVLLMGRFRPAVVFSLGGFAHD